MNEIQRFIHDNNASITLINEKSGKSRTKDNWFARYQSPRTPVSFQIEYNEEFTPLHAEICLFPDKFHGQTTLSMDAESQISGFLVRVSPGTYKKFDAQMKKVKELNYSEEDEFTYLTEEDSGSFFRIEQRLKKGRVLEEKQYENRILQKWFRSEVCTDKETVTIKDFSKSESYTQTIIYKNNLPTEIKTLLGKDIIDLRRYQYLYDKNGNWNICIKKTILPASGEETVFKRYNIDNSSELSGNDLYPDLKFTRTVNGKNLYIGQISKGYYNKFGVYFFENKSFYIGLFKDNIFQGKGLWIRENGTVLYGNFKGGHLHGQGLCYNPEKGFLYRGNFKLGRFEGEGCLYHSNGTMYCALFHNNTRTKQGIITKHSLIFQKSKTDESSF